MEKNIMILNLGSHFGGTEKYIFNIVENIDFDKYNIHLCCKKGTKFTNELKKIKKQISIYELEFSKKNIIKSIKEIRKYIVKNNIDIVHSNGISADLICNMARKGIKNVKVLSTVHGFSSFDRMDRSKLEIKLFDIIEKSLFRYNDYYIAVSNSLKDYLIERGLDENKVDVIYHGVTNLNDEVYKNRSENNTITIGSVGRLEKVKGYDILLKSISVLKSKGHNIKCLLVGDGSEYDYLLNLSKKLCIEECIEFLGHKEDIYSYIDEMDIYIQPSRQESFGISIIEGMNKVKPVIASKVGGVVEIIENEKNGLLFTPLNYEELADKINYLINNKIICKELANEGKKSVENKFSMEIFMRKIDDIYKKI